MIALKLEVARYLKDIVFDEKIADRGVVARLLAKDRKRVLIFFSIKSFFFSIL